MANARIAMQKFARVPESLQHSVDRTRVQYRRLGSSGLRVSNPILGGASFGSSRFCEWVLDEDKALPILKAAYERGINTWDTANTYSNGESEKIIAKAISDYQIPREKVIIMTKCFRPVCDPQNYDPGAAVVYHHKLAAKSKDYVNQWGLSRASIFNAVDASLRRLNTTYIDVLQIHRFDDTVPPEETMYTFSPGALHDLIRAGMVRYIGASSMWAHQLSILQQTAEAKGYTKFISMQNHYNLLYREEEREMNPYCNATGIGLIPAAILRIFALILLFLNCISWYNNLYLDQYSPLASGRLARPPKPQNLSVRMSTAPNGGFYGGDDDRGSETILSRVEEIARRHDWPISHVALAWLSKRVTAPILGLNSVERIDEALAASGKELTAQEEVYLEEAYLPRPVLGHS